MNKLSGIIRDIKSVDGVSHIFVDVEDKIFSILVLSGDEEYQKGEIVNLLFKETEVMIASKESIVSARNSFVSPITYINMGEILAEVHFDFDGIYVVSVVTIGAVEDLKCNVGEQFRWFVKSNEVSIIKG